MTTTPPAPTLTAHTDADPCPRVEVLITTMPGDADTLTIWRSWRGQRTVVRGVNGVEVAGDFLVVDYEVPLGAVVTYTCATADVAGVPSQESSGTAVTVTVDDAWMQDPLDPTTALPVRLTRTSTTAGVELIGDSLMPATYSADGSVSPVVGSPLGIGFGGVRRAASRMPLALIAWSTADATALRTLIAQAYPLCVRTPADIPQLTGLTYMALGDLLEAPYPGWTSTLFTSTADSVRGPGSAIVVQERTYDDLLTEAATYDDLLPLYATYVDLQRGL